MSCVARFRQEIAAQKSAALGKSGQGCAGIAGTRVRFQRFFVSCLIALTAVSMSAKRASYNLKFKRAAISFAEDNGNHSAAAEFGVGRGCIIRWRKQRDQIFKGAVTCKKFTGPRKGRHPELKEEVCELVRSERNRGFAVTADAIQTKAMEIARRIGDSSRGVPCKPWLGGAHDEEERVFFETPDHSMPKTAR
ncbi:hypothetical protein MTO96_030223 [Rhipicephalus appendiculatus]